MTTMFSSVWLAYCGSGDAAGACEAWEQARFATQGEDVAHGLYVALGEAQVADRARDAAVLDEEGAVAGHAGKHLFVGLDLADVPQACHQHAALGLSDHLRG